MSDSTSAMPNGFDILKKMWEAFSPPATFTSPLTQLMQSAAPLLDPNEIENRIAEMRAVEQWLTLNLNVLRSTIQAFEVQRATYATLRAFGSGGFGASSASADTGAASGTSEGSEAPSFGQASGFWRSPFGATEPAQDVEASQGEPEPEPEPAPEASAGAQEASSEAGDTSSPFAQAGQAYAALDPSMWFNAMRAQFDQIAAAAQAAGMSAAQMTEAAAAQMSDAAAKATHTTSTRPSGAGAAKTSKASKTAGKTGAAGKAASGATKAAGKTAAAKRAPASKKPPAKSAAAKTSAKTSTKAAAKTARTAAGSDDTASSAPAAGKTSGKQGSWKW